MLDNMWKLASLKEGLKQGIESCVSTPEMFDVLLQRALEDRLAIEAAPKKFRWSLGGQH